MCWLMFDGIDCPIIILFIHVLSVDSIILAICHCTRPWSVLLAGRGFRQRRFEHLSSAPGFACRDTMASPACRTVKSSPQLKRCHLVSHNTSNLLNLIAKDIWRHFVVWFSRPDPSLLQPGFSKCPEGQTCNFKSQQNQDTVGQAWSGSTSF